MSARSTNRVDRLGRGWRLLALAVALCAVAAGCSSTNERAADDVISLGPGEVRQDASSPEGTAEPGSGGEAEVAVGEAPPDLSDAASQRTGDGSAAQPSAGADGGSAPPPSVPGGAESGPILVGSYGHQTFQGADFGLNNATLGDPAKLAAIMVDWINKNGGVIGRPLKLVTHGSPVFSEQKAQDDQAACAKFTEDNKVVAATSIVVTTPVIFECMAKHNVFYVFDTVFQPDAGYMAKHPTLYAGVPSQERVGRVTADALKRVGYFDGAKVGTVNVDHPWWASGTKAFKEEAARYGVKSLVDVTICEFCDASERANDARQGVIKMRQAGVTHVVLLGGTVSSEFTQEARNSNFYPRYGLSSQMTPALLNLLAGTDQLIDAVGAGWIPAVDVDAGQEPPKNAKAKLCEQVMAAAGEREDNRLKAVQMRMTCNTFLFMREAYNLANATDPSRVMTAVESMGASYESATTFRTFFGPGRHDGADAYRVIAYDVTCACFKYTTGDVPFPSS